MVPVGRAATVWGTAARHLQSAFAGDVQREDRDVGKPETLRAVAERSGMSQKQVSDVIDMFIEEMACVLDEDGRFAYPDLGVFTVKTRAARVGRNPRTSEPVQIPAKCVVRFKASRRFVERAT